MSRIISIHSYRGGTGKSNTTASLAALIAQQGRRVGVIDTDLNSPGIHMPFGLDLESDSIQYTLNNYLWGHCEIQEAAYKVSDNMEGLTDEIFLVPASVKASEITRLLRDGYDVGLLHEGFDQLLDRLSLDVLMVDTHPGLSNETLMSIAITDVLLIILRPDHQDYQGTAVTVEVARKLDVLDMKLIINKMPLVYNFKDVKERVENLYNCEVAAILPHADEMMTLASQDIFALRYPDHPITTALSHLANRLSN